ncbi:FAD-dependent oxidoreductase [Dactylosporangium siamense]|uniref:FAD-dependent oxidoreductase n=1 Tax=Dactylosporangium siamense TaxID=685454 RepID=UPI001941077C|nr:FAD-dependent oxidoreductase [Dactylosporangium siamense]
MLGASVAGLLAARVLSESFATVTVFDRDTLPAGAANRKGVPQDEYAHGFLARGRQVLEGLFPGIVAELTAEGAIPIDIMRDCVWVTGDRAMPRVASGLAGLCVSRPLIEAGVRRRVMALPGVTVLDGHEATGLLFDGTRVTGAKVLPVGGATGRDVAADLVVDATGRGNRGPTWLAELGFERPAEERVDPRTVYVSRDYRRVPGAQDFTAILNAANAGRPFGAVAIGVDGDRWMTTLIGIGTGQEPTAGAMLEFAAKLPDPRFHQLISTAEPLGPPARVRLPPSVRRRYERIRRLPDGLVAIGDAICAFNPSYGQGMTVAAVEALQLRDALRSGGRAGLPRRFYTRAAKVVDVPWDIAVGADLAHPEVEGVRTGKTRLLNAYVAKIQTASGFDAAVAGAFLRVANMTQAPPALFTPGVVARTLWFGRQRR